MKYIELGKIAFSNNIAYVGQYISLSETNYNMVRNYMDTFIKDKSKCFEDFKNDFFYHVYEYVNEGIERNIAGRKFKDVKPVYKLRIFFTVDIVWPFDLYYDSSEPEAGPIDIYLKEVVNVGEIG